MVTYAQLESEPAWNREMVTPELDWLGDEFCRRLGRPRAAAGSKGDNEHLNGAHRSQEWIINSRYCTNRTYTVQAGLTPMQLRYVSGFDLTPGQWGTTVNAVLMRAQTRRLIDAYDGGKLPEVREIYGRGMDNTVVGRRNGRPATSDSSHLEHWHLSIDRRELVNRALMERIVGIALGDKEEGDDDMPTVDEIWAKRFAEYVDEDGDGTRETRTVADILYATHRAALEMPALREQVAELATDNASMRETLEVILSRLPAPPPADG